MIDVNSTQCYTMFGRRNCNIDITLLYNPTVTFPGQQVTDKLSAKSRKHQQQLSLSADHTHTGRDTNFASKPSNQLHNVSRYVVYCTQHVTQPNCARRRGPKFSVLDLAKMKWRPRWQKSSQLCYIWRCVCVVHVCVWGVCMCVCGVEVCVLRSAWSGMRVYVCIVF